MQKLQCELCGSVDIVRTDDGFFRCEHCGCKYTLEQAKAMLGTVETTIGTAERERLLANAQTQFDLGQFAAAEKTYSEVTKQFPDDYRGWLGLLRVNCKYYLAGERIYLPGTKFNSSPLDSEAKQLGQWHGICKRLAPPEGALAEIEGEWERFWNEIAAKCKSGEFEYQGGSDLDFYRGTCAAMYEYVKSGEENARVLNSMSACYKTGSGWVPRQAHTTPPYRFWLGRCCQTEGGECENIRALPDLQPLDEGKIAEIRAQLNKFINEAVAFGYCPYCGSALRDTPLGPECENCGKSF